MKITVILWTHVLESTSKDDPQILPFVFVWATSVFPMSGTPAKRSNHRSKRLMFCFRSWWRHQMETFSALLAICVGTSPVTGEFPAQRPVTQSFDVFFDLHPAKRLSKQWWGWWFETPSRPWWRHCNGHHGFCLDIVGGHVDCYSAGSPEFCINWTQLISRGMENSSACILPQIWLKYFLIVLVYLMDREFKAIHQSAKMLYQCKALNRRTRICSLVDFTSKLLV